MTSSAASKKLLALGSSPRFFRRRAVIHNGLAAEIDAARAKQAKEYLSSQILVVS